MKEGRKEFERRQKDRKEVEGRKVKEGRKECGRRQEGGKEIEGMKVKGGRKMTEGKTKVKEGRKDGR